MSELKTFTEPNFFVILAKAGICVYSKKTENPAFAGMTELPKLINKSYIAKITIDTVR